MMTVRRTGDGPCFAAVFHGKQRQSYQAIVEPRELIASNIDVLGPVKAATKNRK
jgi:hypothetical protein